MGLARAIEAELAKAKTVENFMMDHAVLEKPMDFAITKYL